MQASHYYFHPLTLHLIHAPADLKETVEGPGQKVVAGSWLHEILQPQWQPPDDAMRFFSKKWDGVCDCVRATWTIGDISFEAAQSLYILTITIFRDESATDAARTFLSVDDEDIAFREAGEIPDLGTWGEQDPSRIDIPPWPRWTHALKWWIGEGAVGFVTLKLPGGPTQSVITFDEESNRIWVP